MQKSQEPIENRNPERLTTRFVGERGIVQRQFFQCFAEVFKFRAINRKDPAEDHLPGCRIREEVVWWIPAWVMVSLTWSSPTSFTP